MVPELPGFGGFGRILVVMGLMLVLFGLMLEVVGRGWLGPIGRLPGDIYVRRGNFQFYFPLATSLLLSVVLTVLLGLLRR